jgi:iron complex transport system permease protein
MVVIGLTLLLGVILLLGLGLGTANIDPGRVWCWMMGKEIDSSQAMILGSLRLPRLMVAALVGASLALCGTVFQGVLRNPLAEPFILGVSGGAAAGAVAYLAWGQGGRVALALAAFAGAVGAVLLVLGVARREGRMDTSTLVLAGVMINAFFTSAIMFVISTTDDQQLHAIMFWLYGDLGGADLGQAAIIAPVLLVCSLTIWRYARQLNLLLAGDQAAAAAGVGVERVKFVLFLTVSLLCGVTVSFSGLIGFVGLMVPHLMRLIVGHDHRLLLPAAGLFGAAFLMAADTTARLAISPAQLPVGVVTAFLGAPFFLMLLYRRGSQWF